MGTTRFLLALSVLIVHSSPLFGIELLPGYMAVQSFYIISGFLMIMVFTEKYIRTERPYYYFITNRILRLYPLYITIVLLTLFVSIGLGLFTGSYGKLQFYFARLHDAPQSLAMLIFIFFSNFLMVGQDIISFFSINKSTGNLYFLGLQNGLSLQDLFIIPIGWTVAVEFLFYLVTPFIANKTLKIVLAVIAVVLLLRLALFVTGAATKSFAIFRFAPTEIFWFLLGILSYKLGKINTMPGAKWASWLVAAILLFMISYHYINNDFKDYLFFLLIFISCPALFAGFAKNKTDKLLGDLCYPVYLSHCLVLLIVGANRFPKPFGPGVPTLILTLILSVFVNKFILVPLERYRQNRIPKII